MADSDDNYYDDIDEIASNVSYNSDEFESYDRTIKDYTVISEADIRQRQVDNIDTVSSILNITKEAASVLLRHYGWITSNVHDAWFCNQEKVSKSVGLLLDGPVVNFRDNKRIKCRICYETKRCDKFSSTACGHLFCIRCWKQYADTSINDGPGCLTLRCPDPKCRSAVPQDMIEMFVSDVNKNKYARFLVHSYVEGNPKIKWCPAPGCEYAIENDDAGIDDEGGSYMDLSRPKIGYDVMCRCSNGFCWNCNGDAHRPVDCDTVANWTAKNKAESENTTWILAYTKPCPKCKRSIEKDKGCMHMTCPCKFQFCWLCLGPWSGHQSFYACNRYDKSKNSEAETRRENAKQAAVRYTHYYERWDGNEKSRRKAVEDLRSMSLEKISCALQTETVKQLEFIMKAWVQIVECRRVLKWTYAYGYYLPKDSDKEKAKKEFFEYLQGEAEAGLEKLHHCAETELGRFLDADYKPNSDGFNCFRVKLTGLTKTTETYFKNLVSALEDGL